MSGIDDMIFTKDHLWIRHEGDVYTVGMSEEGLEDSGDIMFVELPVLDSEVEADDDIGCTESVKTVSPLISPMSGTIVSVNSMLIDEPQKINESPYGEGWLFKIRPSHPLTFGKSVERNG